MHQNRHIANKISVIIFNFKVIYLNRLIKSFKFRTRYNSFWTVKSVDFISSFKLSCCYPAFSNDIEWVIWCCINISARSMQVQYLVTIMNIDYLYFFQLCFACFSIICPDLVVDFNFINAFLTIFICYKSFSGKAP